MALITSGCVPLQPHSEEDWDMLCLTMDDKDDGEPVGAANAREYITRKAKAEVTSWLTAAKIPMDNPYCSCKLTRVRGSDDRPGRARAPRDAGRAVHGASNDTNQPQVPHTSTCECH